MILQFTNSQDFAIASEKQVEKKQPKISTLVFKPKGELLGLCKYKIQR